MHTMFANVSLSQVETTSGQRTSGDWNCWHPTRCPDATAADFRTARVVAGQPSQGWSLLCNGVVLFDDGGALLPDGAALQPGAIQPPLGAAPGLTLVRQ